MLDAMFAMLVGALAGAQITETVHHGSIFGPLRERAAVWASKRGVRKFLGELVRCPFCLSHWSCATAVVWLWWGSDPWSWPIYALAATRLAQLLNDVSHPITRSPSDAEVFEQVLDDEDGEVAGDAETP